MKRKIIILAILCVGLLLFYIKLTDYKNVNILTDLEGEIYYIMKDDDHISKLYKSDANLKNKTLIYSHEGKGTTSSGGSNDNILDFRYYPDTQKIEIEVMYEGEWSILELRPGSHEPKYLRKLEEIKTGEYGIVHNINVDYIYSKLDEFEIYGKSKSIFMSTQDEEKCILKYKGLPEDDSPFDKRFTGYFPHGLSPDGKYLVYGTTNDKIGIGAILGFKEYKIYIMNIETKEYTEYVDAHEIQWVLE